MVCAWERSGRREGGFRGKANLHPTTRDLRTQGAHMLLYMHVVFDITMESSQSMCVFLYHTWRLDAGTGGVRPSMTESSAKEAYLEVEYPHATRAVRAPHRYPATEKTL